MTAIVATGISISISLRQLKVENDKIFKELFIQFNTKFNENFQKELEKIVEKHKNNIDYEVNEFEKILIIEYLNFCSEEYLWYKRGRIYEEVWTAWENGMLYYFNKKPINKVIIKEKIKAQMYYMLFDKIGKQIDGW